MKKNGYAEATINETHKKLKTIAKNANLDKPEEVKEYIANLNGKNSYKEGLVCTYDRYAICNNITWSKPIYYRTSQPPYVPTQEETTILIANAGTKYALILSIFRDTGIRPIELQRSTLKWYDLTRGTVNVETAKHGEGRTLKLKPQTLAMFKDYLAKNNFELNSHPFPKVITMNKSLQRIRARTAKKLKRPELAKICLYSFRHYFATMLYHKTKSILIVQEQLGHRNIKNTMIYTHLINFVDDEYTTATATTAEQACKLIQVGYEKSDEFDGIHIYKKRK